MKNLIETDLSLTLPNLQEKAREVFDLLDISEGTRRDYAYRISLFLAFIARNGFNKNSFLEFKRSLKDRDDLTVATKNKYLASARVFLRELTRNGLMPLDITLNIKGFRQNKKHKKEGLSEGEIEKIRDKIKTFSDTPTNIRIKALFCLFTLQGLRQIEVIRLNREDLDLVNGIAYIQGKGQDDKEMIYLHPQTVKTLRLYIRICRVGSGAMFKSLGNRKSSRLSSRTIKRDFESLFSQLGVKKSVHGFRHYFVTHLLKSFEVSTVRKFSRHKSLDMLIIYDDEVDLVAKKDKVFDCFSGMEVV